MRRRSTGGLTGYPLIISSSSFSGSSATARQLTAASGSYEANGMPTGNGCAAMPNLMSAVGTFTGEEDHGCRSAARRLTRDLRKHDRQPSTGRGVGQDALSRLPLADHK
jgi:hypothetical protein